MKALVMYKVHHGCFNIFSHLSRICHGDLEGHTVKSNMSCGYVPVKCDIYAGD